MILSIRPRSRSMQRANARKWLLSSCATAEAGKASASRVKPAISVNIKVSSCSPPPDR